MTQYDRGPRGLQRRGGDQQPRGWQQPPSDFPAPSAQEIEAIIRNGDAKTLVESARRVGEALAARGLSSGQIRGVFGSVRRIEMRWPHDATQEVEDREIKELLLLKPRLAYQVGRARQGSAGQSKSIADLEPVLRRGIDLVSDRTHFGHFVEYLEAILAYHKFSGGR